MPEPHMESSFYPMTKHYILTLNPSAQHEWDRCTLRNPITAERPDLAALIADAVGEEAGSYLVAVHIEVQVLEKAPIAQPERVSVDVSATQKSQRKELVAKP
ncbi:hypothetical protein NDI42_21805 [Funiculus sociatus GB2-C1]|uniref:hypothetical protein n=2 Tax=Cyanobacteriota TaxID=1117 RepID=UPI001F54896B|nr:MULTISPECIES: hypothetical protein [unclassified Trichocoleus]